MPTPSWAWPNCSPGTCPMPPSACANRAAYLGRRGQAVLHRAARGWPLYESSRPCSTCAWWKRRYRPGTPTCAACAWKARGRADRPSVPGPVRARRQAERRLVDSERTRRLAGGRLRTPVAYLTCNFSRPNGERAPQLTHDDVITLFHETGHALHALLSEVDEPGAAAPAWNGTPSNCPRNSWRTSAGNGPCGSCRPTPTPARRCRARSTTA